MDRIALVTGASRGIGHAAALALAGRGLGLVLAAEGSVAELEAAVAACRAAGAPRAEWLLADLALPGAAERMVEEALARTGRIDVLVNNAGIRCRKPFGSFSREEFDRVVQVNLGAAFFASQAVLPAMRAQGGGRIIHVASQMASVAAEDNALYGLTKAALAHLAKSMAFELAGENIQVNAVSPGPIATAYNLESYGRQPGKMAQMTARVPAGRFGAPEEVAATIAWLATKAPAFLQGHDLVVDGGYIIH
ncbi:MAG: SDR family oxidoreductase [Acetobacteraceae bacterium]|nr:SDR family oxidoreductase [Acetobacteraceae bacterium]